MEEISLFYATGNKSKLHNMIYRLRDYPIKVLCPQDIGVHIEVEEDGKSAVENALLKAKAYYDVVSMPTIAGDSGVRIDGIDEHRQPGLFVRRVGGKVLSDEEMVDYYSALAKDTEGPCFLNYFTGIALVTDRGTFTMELKEEPLKLSSIPNENRNHRGNPLDVITQVEDGRFFNDLSDEERTARDLAGELEFTHFIVTKLMGYEDNLDKMKYAGLE